MIEDKHYQEVFQKKDEKINKLLVENSALKDRLSVFEKQAGPNFKETQSLIAKLTSDKVNLLADAITKDAEISRLKALLDIQNSHI